MAEQDRKDLVPSVLNDLMDVDGEPADGDALVREGGVWAPTAGPLPPYGPALTFYEAYSPTANLADDNAIKAAWIALNMAHVPNYQIVNQPPTGTWTGEAWGSQVWRATEPGIYSAYVWQSISLSATPTAGARVMQAEPGSYLLDYTWTMDRIPRLAHTQQNDTAGNITLFVSQGMIDAGVGGLAVRTPRYITSGAERVNSLYMIVAIERQSPGSTFDYYSEL